MSLPSDRKESGDEILEKEPLMLGLIVDVDVVLIEEASLPPGDVGMS